MKDSFNHGFKLPPEQQAIRNKCFHPSGTFVEFPLEDVETSIPARFEKIVRLYPWWLAVVMSNWVLTHDNFNRLVFVSQWKGTTNKMHPRKKASCLIRLSLFAAITFRPWNALAETPHVLHAGGFDADAYVSWPVLIAQQKGFFAKEGIQLELIRTDRAMMALIAGGLEVINAGVSAGLAAGERGASLSMVHVLCDKPAEYMVLRRPLTTLRELDGETVGVYQVPSTVQMFLKKHLQKNGVDLSRITFRALGASRERYASLLAGQSSATLLSMTYAYRAQQEGLKIVAFPEDWERVPWNVVTFRKSWAEANPTVVVRYLRAIRQATMWLYEPAYFNEAVRLIVPPSRLEDHVVRWGLRSAIENRIFNLSRPNTERFQTFAGWLASEGILPKSFNVAPLVDARYYDLAVKR